MSTVDMSRLKPFVAKQLRPGSPLREILLSEPDVMSTEAFLERLNVWLRLADMETAP